jgi:hypothetical protein
MAAIAGSGRIVIIDRLEKPAMDAFGIMASVRDRTPPVERPRHLALYSTE